MKINNTLILGASGFIGRNLATRLINSPENDNSKIVLLAHHEDSLGDFKKDNVVIIKGDISDYNSLCNIITKYDINTIYHFASNSIVRKCANDPMSAYITNVMGTVTILEAVRNVGMNTVKKIIISTSDKVYGHAQHPYNETTPFEPRYTYESTKACQDIVAQNYFYNYNLPINIIRCSNVYGLQDPNTSRLVPNVIKSINNGENPKVHSGVADFIREFVYIEDVIDAMFLIREKAENGEVYCIGGTEEISILDLVTKISEFMGHKGGVDIIEKPANFQEIKEQSIDSSKLRKLGWTPKYSLDEGIKECVSSGFYR
ncbi:MAG: GDP-mannose 4,6-dehydratase [Candidatus Paceibacterota bacterium]|jgi:nucleoside-diphosphate-sugar epimerase